LAPKQWQLGEQFTKALNLSYPAIRQPNPIPKVAFTLFLDTSMNYEDIIEDGF
jgi:hypothetical protein